MVVSSVVEVVADGGWEGTYERLTARVEMMNMEWEEGDNKVRLLES